MPDSLSERYRQGDRLALAHLLTLAAHGRDIQEALAAASARAKPARVVAVTGSAGVGKSTLIGKLIEHLRQNQQTVAVLACDPQSPLSGGALLGDRFRMPSRPDDPGVFIRSLAAAAGHGAVAEHLDRMVQLLEGFGFDVILIETVGAGQGDTAVRDLADLVLLLLQPETGDDLQWEKAGLLEVADVIAIHKADLPRAEQVESQVRGMLSLGNGPEVPIVRVSSKTGQGIETLWSALAAGPLRRACHADNGRALLQRAQESLASWFTSASRPVELNQLLERWRQGKLSEKEALRELFQLHQESG